MEPSPHWDLVRRGLENGPLFNHQHFPNPRKSAMSRIEEVAVYQHLARGIGLPFERAFHNSSNEGTDEHDRRYEVEWRTGATVVRGAGEDGVFGTEDDLRVTWIETGDAALRLGGPAR